MALITETGGIHQTLKLDLSWKHGVRSDVTTYHRGIRWGVTLLIFYICPEKNNKTILITSQREYVVGMNFYNMVYKKRHISFFSLNHV